MFCLVGLFVTNHDQLNCIATLITYWCNSSDITSGRLFAGVLNMHQVITTIESMYLGSTNLPKVEKPFICPGSAHYVVGYWQNLSICKKYDRFKISEIFKNLNHLVVVEYPAPGAVVQWLDGGFGSPST